MLIVGGSGNLGTVLRAGWPTDGPVRPVWQARGDKPGNWVRVSPLADPEAFARAARGHAAILNLAGVVRGDPEALALNTDLALAAVEAAVRGGVARVLIASSAAVYGAAADRPDESAPCRPASPYGRAKLAMERAVGDRLARGGGPETCLLRIGNVAGADQLLGRGDDRGTRRLALAADGLPPRRSYLGPQALARALAALAVAPGRLPAVLNLSSRHAIGMETLLAEAGIGWTVHAADPPPIARVELDCSAAAALLPEGVLDQDAASVVADWRAACGGRGR